MNCRKSASRSLMACRAEDSCSAGRHPRSVQHGSQTCMLSIVLQLGYLPRNRTAPACLAPKFAPHAALPSEAGAGCRGVGSAGLQPSMADSSQRDTGELPQEQPLCPTLCVAELAAATTATAAHPGTLPEEVQQRGAAQVDAQHRV